MSSAPEYHAPSAPDPNMVAAAQGRQERMAARQNALYLNPSVQSPYGNISYDTNEENIDGETVRRPTQRIQLSPHQEASMNRKNELERYLQETGTPIGRQLHRGVEELGNLEHMRPNLEGIGRVGNEEDYRGDRRRFEDAYYNRQLELMRPENDQYESRLKHRLAGNGHTLGNEAYSKELNRFETQKHRNLTDLGRDAILQGGQEQRNMFGMGQQIRNEQRQEALLPYEVNQTERRNRMGENQFNLAALQGLSQGSPINLPQLQQYQQQGVRAPDMQGMYANNHAQKSQNYNNMYSQEMGNHRANLGGMYGLLGKGIGFAGQYFGGR